MSEVKEGSVCRGRGELPPRIGEYHEPLRERRAEVPAASLVPMTPAEAEDWSDWRRRR